MKKINKYTVIRDSKEKAYFWNFEESDRCLGTIDDKLATGDYTIKGMENIFTIERKFSTGEFSGNIFEDRFERELKRMDKLRHSFLVMEFTLSDVYMFPSNSRIPSEIWPELKVGPNVIVKRLIEIETDHKCKIIFAGNRGEEIATAIFKRMQDLYSSEK